MGVVPLGKLLGVAIAPGCHCDYWLLPWLQTQGVGVVPLGKLLGVAVVPGCHCDYWLLPWLQTRGVGVSPGLHPETQPGG